VDFKYSLEDRPPLLELVLFGLQWLALSIPTIVIIGKIVGALQFDGLQDQVVYLQKTSFVTGVALLCQVLWGHRLPLILGPATVLLIGVIASQRFALNTIYSSILLGGLILALVGVTGVFGHLKRLFTARVVAVVLLLIAFTLVPTMVRLIVPSPAAAPLHRVSFALALVTATFFAHQALTGIWKSTLIVWAMALGSAAYFMVFPATGGGSPAPAPSILAGFWSDLTSRLDVHPGVFISFLFCFLALSINDLGSIQSLDELMRPSGMERRITRGMTLTGLANVLAGFFGVVGVVNYSLSPGVIASTGCASRFTLIPAALALLGLSFSPAALGWIGAVPSLVVGSVLIYVLSAQIAAGLIVAFGAEHPFTFESGLGIGLPVLLGAFTASLPGPVVDTFPTVLRPIVGNGFVMGVAAALVLEHVVFRLGRGPRP
jgi:xanthine/uracil permease